MRAARALLRCSACRGGAVLRDATQTPPTQPTHAGAAATRSGCVVGGVAVPPEPDEAEIEERKCMTMCNVPERYDTWSASGRKA